MKIIYWVLLIITYIPCKVCLWAKKKITEDWPEHLTIGTRKIKGGIR